MYLPTSFQIVFYLYTHKKLDISYWFQCWILKIIKHVMLSIYERGESQDSLVSTCLTVLLSLQPP